MKSTKGQQNRRIKDGAKKLNVRLLLASKEKVKADGGETKTNKQK